MFKRIFCIVLAILVPIALFPVSAFADEQLYTDSVTQYFAVNHYLYSEYMNISTSYTNYTDSGALSAVTDLYNQYASAASDPYTAAALAAAMIAVGTIAVVYDAVTGQGKVALYTSEYVSSLDGYWDYTLSDLGLFRNEDGSFVWEDDGIPVEVLFLESDSFFPSAPTVSSSDKSLVLANGLFCFSGADTSPTYGSTYVAATKSTDSSVCFYISGSSYYVCVLTEHSLVPTNSYAAVAQTTRSSSVTSSLGAHYSNGIDYSTPLHVDISAISSINLSIPLFSSVSEAVSAYKIRDTLTKTVTIEPSTYVGDPLADPDTILLPDPNSPDYNPVPDIIYTNIWWDDANWGSPVPNPTPGVAYRVTDNAILNRALPDIWSQIVDGTVSVEAPPGSTDNGGSGGDTGDPSEVFVPLLPITLPDFNFSLSGIWYYVVRWVESIGSWISLMFTVWASLPYAFVAPVYASAVIVIVLGVYKRFFM